jgi:hypothetical protein
MAVAAGATGSWDVRASLFISQHEEAQLAPALVQDSDNCISTLPAVRMHGSIIRCEVSEAPAWSWYVLEPVALDYDNSESCFPMTKGCTQPISYRYRELTYLHGRGQVSSREIQRALGPGTHWINATRSSSPPDEPLDLKSRPPGFELVVRRDDSYVGYLTELLGVPFVYLPALTPAGEHQTEARLGTDCVALVVYGQRRLGKKLRYMAPPALVPFTQPIPRDASGEHPISEGDILYFGFQTAVLSQDRERIGLLDEEDLVIHTYHGRAEEVAFAALPYRRSAFEVRRWRTD